MWDNRLTKRNAKAPDYKCRDASCDGVIWPPKGPKGNGAKQAHSAGPHVPGMDAEPAAPKLGLFATYDKCLTHVLEKVVPRLTAADVGASPESVAAITATLFIAAKERGAAA